MESWCFDDLEKSYVLNETMFLSDSIIRTKNVVLGFSYDDSAVVLGQQSVENPGFSDEGCTETVRKLCALGSVKNLVNTNANVGGIVCSSVVTSNVIFGDEESSSKPSSSVVESNSRESSLIDLKLGGFGDNMNSGLSGSAPMLSSSESPKPAKRPRVSSLSSQSVYCQVYGCNKDLSSSKDYHKRHKVCEAHSKSAKVVVNGIEQRFCQQCSRFHLLAEFDDGKRSCRKRLAGHNERRRKPQVSFTSNQTGRLLQPYSGFVGSKFQGTTLAGTSIISKERLSTSDAHMQNETNGWGRHIKVEDGLDSDQNLSNTCTNEKTMSPYLFGKQLTYISDNTNRSGSGTVFSENNYLNEVVSRSLIPKMSFGNEDLINFDSASTVQRLPGISESGFALSLLSSQSAKYTGHSSGSHPLVTPSSSPHYSMSEVSQKLHGGTAASPTNGTQGYSCRIRSAKRSYLNAMTMFENDDAVKSDFTDGTIQGSEFMSIKGGLQCEDSATIDLLQLSSQLQRVENQRQSAAVTHEMAGFCSLKMT